MAQDSLSLQAFLVSARQQHKEGCEMKLYLREKHRGMPSSIIKLRGQYARDIETREEQKGYDLVEAALRFVESCFRYVPLQFLPPPGSIVYFTSTQIIFITPHL